MRKRQARHQKIASKSRLRRHARVHPGRCNHPANHLCSKKLLMECPDCGTVCSGKEIGDDDLCYDQSCPLHVMATMRRKTPKRHRKG